MKLVIIRTMPANTNLVRRPVCRVSLSKPYHCGCRFFTSCNINVQHGAKVIEKIHLYPGSTLIPKM